MMRELNVNKTRFNKWKKCVCLRVFLFVQMHIKYRIFDHGNKQIDVMQLSFLSLLHTSSVLQNFNGSLFHILSVTVNFCLLFQCTYNYNHCILTDVFTTLHYTHTTNTQKKIDFSVRNFQSVRNVQSSTIRCVLFLALNIFINCYILMELNVLTFETLQTI